MTQTCLKRLLILNIPYVLIGLYATKLAEAWRLAEGTEMSEKLLHLMDGFLAAFRSPWPSFVPSDLLLGVALGCLLRLAVYEKSRNAKKYRRNAEYIEVSQEVIDCFESAKKKKKHIVEENTDIMLSIHWIEKTAWRIIDYRF